MKIHRPRKNTQVNRLRALLLNINDGIIVTAQDFGISQKEMNSYFDAFVKNGLISLFDSDKPYVSTSYTITDIDKYNKIVNNIYLYIEKFIVPIISSILGVLPEVATSIKSSRLGN